MSLTEGAATVFFFLGPTGCRMVSENNKDGYGGDADGWWMMCNEEMKGQIVLFYLEITIASLYINSSNTDKKYN